MLTRTEGIVLKTRKYGEADLIVTYLTRGKGIIKAFARSPRKTKSRFGSSMEPLTYARISLWGKEHSMPKITQSDIINSFYYLRENLQDFSNISKLIEILISLTPEDIPNKRLFSFFLNIIGLMHSLNKQQKNILYLISQIRLIRLMGYAPRIGGCGKCGAKSLDFYPSLGTTMCRKCAVAPIIEKNTPMKLTNKTINFYSHTIKWPISVAIRLRPSLEIVSELSALIDEYLNYLLGKRPLSSEFLDKLK